METDAGEQEALGNYAEIHLYNLFKGEVPIHTRKKKTTLWEWKELVVVQLGK